MKYKLGDYTVKNWNDWDRVPRDPITIGAAIAGALSVTSVVGIAIITGLTAIAISAVTSWAVSALSPKPDFSSFGAGGGSRGGSAGTLVNVKQAASPADFVYGEVRKGGVISFYESTGTDNKFLHQVIVIAGHEIQSIDDIYVNDEIVSVDGSDFVTGDWKSKIRVKIHLGDQTAADTDLVAETSVDTSFVGNGLAYLYVRYEYDQDVFANGLPLITVMVKGKKVYDPRTSTTAYSNNAALCIRDYITSVYGLSDSAIDDVTFSAAANECDELITLSGGGTEKRYAVNGIATSATPIKTVLGDMSTACAGTIFWGSGYWKLKVGAYSTPVKTLTLDDLRGPISLDTRTTMRDNFNTIRGTFNDASQDYITADYPELTSTVFKTEDNGEEVALDLPFPYTTSASAAQRLAKLTLYRSREQMTINADFGLEALSIEVGDIIGFTNERYGFDEKEFEVVGWRFTPDPEAGDLRVNLTLRETSASAYDWNAEETAIINNNSTLPAFNFVPPVGLNVVGAELRLANEQVVGVILVDVTLNPLRADKLEFQFRKHGAAEFVPVGTTSSVLSSNRFEVVGINDGFFDFRARAINNIGVRGEWRTIENRQISLFAAPPQDVQNLASNVVGNTLHLSWTPVTDLDLSHYKLRYSPTTSGAAYQNSIDVLQKISRPANSVTLPSKVGTYFIKAIDKLGNPSLDSQATVVQTSTADIDQLNSVFTETENPAFAGAKSNIVRLTEDGGVNPYITLDTTATFDSFTGDFDDAVGLFDGGGGTVVASGIYYFEDYVDLGDKYVSRVQANMDVSFIDYVNDFDAVSGLFDTREGNFDGDTAQFDTTSARTQISFTNDNPAAAPTWSDWSDFFVGDIAARALRFRVILESSNPANAPSVSSLNVQIDMPDRVESEDDITYTGSRVVSFPSSFRAKPAIGIAATLADGDRYAITGKSRSGFTITTYTGASISSNAVTFDYVAKGYGKELSA